MRKNAPIIIVIVLLLVGGFLLMIFADPAGERRLDRSLIGLNGLALWLKENDIPAVQSNPRSSDNVTEFSLRVFPLYDVDLVVQEKEPADTKQLMRQYTQRDIDLEAFWEKVAQMPTVVLLPKWTTGFVETGIAHERTLIRPSGFSRLFEQLELNGLTLQREGPEFAAGQMAGENTHHTALFHAQTFAEDSLPDGCDGYLRFGRGVLVMSCTQDNADHLIYFVSDPDLMNNHGLSIAANADFAADMLVQLTRGDSRPIYLDASPVPLPEYEVNDERQDYERSGSDLARFFAYPLSILWAVMLIVLAVLFWRGAIRFGPLEREDDPSINQAKTVAIATKARLLRLSESDGEMVSDFVRHQLSELTAQTLGPDLGDTGLKRFFEHLSRKDAELAAAFRDISERLTLHADIMTQTELSKGLERYRNLLEKVTRLNGSPGIPKTR